MPTRRDRIEGGVLGALIGDALGVPFEFKEPHELPPPERIDLVPPPGFSRAHADVPPGTWSDDGALLLALLESLLQRSGRFDADDFGGRLVAWRRDGRLAVDGRVFDVGIQTDEALARIAAGTPAAGAGSAEERRNGNGGLMRVLPLAFAARGDDAALVDAAERQSRVTHAHPRSEACAALYALWARRTLEGARDPWSEAAATLRRIYAADPARLREVNEEIRPDDASPGRGTGYVVDSLRSARWCVAQGSYERVVRAAVALGHDADTTACLAGGVAGLRDGVSAVPARWRQMLRGAEIYRPLLARALAQCGGGDHDEGAAASAP
jgi:ADP-ribosylglycohydrolase